MCGCEYKLLWLQGLKPRQLAVLFRNNHFNTLFKIEDALYVLVTDQGYLHEQAGQLSTCTLMQYYWSAHVCIHMHNPTSKGEPNVFRGHHTLNFCLLSKCSSSGADFSFHSCCSMRSGRSWTLLMATLYMWAAGSISQVQHYIGLSNLLQH